jgi:hypothetical protein
MPRTVTGTSSPMSKLLVDVRCPNTASVYTPGLSTTFETRLNPEN